MEKKAAETKIELLGINETEVRQYEKKKKMQRRNSLITRKRNL